MENRVGIGYESGEKKENNVLNRVFCGLMYIECIFRTCNFRKLLIDELKIYVESRTLRVNVGMRKFWSRESFNSTYC